MCIIFKSYILCHDMVFMYSLLFMFSLCDFSLYQSLPNRDRFKFLRCEGGGIDVMLAYMLGRHIYVPYCRLHI